LKRTFQLYTDTMNVTALEVLTQKDNVGIERVIAYESKTLSGLEQNYKTFDKDFLSFLGWWRSLGHIGWRCHL